jgi:hypothetical protein
VQEEEEIDVYDVALLVAMAQADGETGGTEVIKWLISSLLK